MKVRALGLALLLSTPTSALQDGSVETPLLGDLLSADQIGTPELAVLSQREGIASEVFEAFATRSLALADGSFIPLTSQSERVLVQVIENVGRPLTLVPILAAFEADQEPVEAVYQAAYILLEAVGTFEDLDFLDALLERGKNAEVFDGIGQFGSAIIAITRRDPRALESLSSLFDSASIEKRVAIIRAAGAADSMERMEWCGRRLGVDPALDVTILCELGRTTQVPASVSALTSESVVRLLDSDDGQVKREAVRVCAALAIDNAAPKLIELLEDPSAVISSMAADSLERITGIAFGTAVGRWKAWLRAEEAWFAERVPELTLELSNQDAGRAIRAIGELASHRYRRGELSRSVAMMLGDNDPAVQSSALRGLRRLGSCASLKEISELLGDAVHGAEAQATLQALTGLDAESVTLIAAAAY